MSHEPDPSDSAAEQPHAETPAEHVAAVQKKKNLYLRITSSMPLLITVIVHVVLIGIAGAVVVQQNIVGKKKTFEAANAGEAVKQVEHRLQVARRGGASGGASSPVSANRIFSTAAGALAMPEMPDLPSMGAGGFGGFGGMGSGVGMGAGQGMSTSLGGGTGLGGRGFMSLSFLGTTNQNVSKVVFVVDTSTDIMEPRRGGFEAFAIIREEIMRLVGRLPPSAQFNVILFRPIYGNHDRGAEVNVYKSELVVATSDNKKDFFSWMTPVNSRLGTFGPYSASRRTEWRSKPVPPEAGLDPLFIPPVWARGVHAALEMQPEVIYVITASQGTALLQADEQTIAKRKADLAKSEENFRKEAEKEGMDSAAIRAAYLRAYAKAGTELAEANQKLISAGKNPIVVVENARIFRADVQAELKKNGIVIQLDKTGWTKKDGSVFRVPHSGLSTVEPAEWDSFIAYYARLQRHLVLNRATLNLFLFVGPNDKPETAVTNLTVIAKRNGGTFQLLTTKRLEDMKAREETKTNSSQSAR